MAQDINNFAVTNWVSIPAPWPVAQPPAPGDQKWLIILSGVAIIDFKGINSDDWRWETFRLIIPDLKDAIQASGKKAPKGSALYFQVEQWAPYATLNAIFDKDHSVNAGFAVDNYRPVFQVLSDSKGVKFHNIFSCLEVDAAVRDSDAWIFRIGYNVTLMGKILTIKLPPIE